MQGADPTTLRSPEVRRAGRDMLSLALIDSRNLTLRWAAAVEAHGDAALDATPLEGEPSMRWALGHTAWFQEHWIRRNDQRRFGECAGASESLLGSIWPGADGLFGGPGTAQRAAAQRSLPMLQGIRQYLVETLETTLDLLSGTPDEDAALYFYRLALLREDACIERFAEAAQALGIDTGLLAPIQSQAGRAPMRFPATRHRVGSAPGGLVPDNEKWSHEVALPEFEIDAQAVTWAEYGEFVEDGGYDDARHWAADGWAWVRAQGRRTPRYVDQMRRGVLQQRCGRLVRVPLLQPAMHVSWFEADAWCRWAGRRLPGEAEWEAAAVQGATRGFRWGDVCEWTAGTLRSYPGFDGASPGQPLAAAGAGQRVQRGASFATVPRLRSTTARRGRGPTDDAGFCGFRSCAI